MGNNKNITILVLGAGMGAILAKAQTDNSPLLPDLEAFKIDLDTFASLSAQEVTSLSEQIKLLTDEVTQLKDEHETQLLQFNKQASETILELKSQLKDALNTKADASAKPVVEVDGVKYEVNHGAHGYGSAKEIAADPKKAKKLLKLKGQNVLTEIK